MIIRTFKLKIFHQNEIYALYQRIYDKYKCNNNSNSNNNYTNADTNWDCINQETLRLPELKFPEQNVNEFRSYQTIYRFFFYLYKVEQGIVKASKCIEDLFRDVFVIVNKIINVIDIDKIHKVLYYQYIYKDEFVELIVGKVREGCQNSSLNGKDNTKTKKFLVEEILTALDNDLNEEDMNEFIKDNNVDDICLKIQNVIKDKQEMNCELIDEPVFKLSDDNNNINIFDNLFVETQSNERNIIIHESDEEGNDNVNNINTSEITNNNNVNEIEKLKNLTNDELLTYIFNNNNNNNSNSNNKPHNEGKSKKAKKRKNKNKQLQTKTNTNNNTNTINTNNTNSQTEKEIINFKQNITNNSYNNCNIHKIKPLIHKQWINKISTPNNN